MPKEVIEHVKKHAIPCADEFKIDRSVIPKLASAEVPNTEEGKKFIYCTTRSAGYVAEDGHMIVDNVAAILKGHPLQEKYREALKQCNEITKENHLDTVMAMNICFAERAPVRLLF